MLLCRAGGVRGLRWYFKIHEQAGVENGAGLRDKERLGSFHWWYVFMVAPHVPRGAHLVSLPGASLHNLFDRAVPET